MIFLKKRKRKGRRDEGETYHGTDVGIFRRKFEKMVDEELSIITSDTEQVCLLVLTKLLQGDKMNNKTHPTSIFT